MYTINYEHTDYCNVVGEVAAKMKVCVEKDHINIPSQIGEGYFRYVLLSNGLQCLITNYKLNQDVYLCQRGSDEEFYVLRFNESSIADNLMLKIDNEYIWERKQLKASVILTSSLYDFAYMGSKNSLIKSINVLIPKAWLLKNIVINHVFNPERILQKYLMLKTGTFNFSPFDVDYRTLFNEILKYQTIEFPGTVVEDQLMTMVKKFINELAVKLKIIDEKDKIKISTDEIKRLMTVESSLIKNFSVPPPSISSLSRVGAMSTTSLKNKFKKMYGSTLYEYYQKSRMNRAKVLILTHKYSIKEIGSQLGYSNLSNFSIAFKKEFKQLPSDFLINL